MNEKLEKDIIRKEKELNNKKTPKFIDSKTNTKGYNNLYKTKKQRGRN